MALKKKKTMTGICVGVLSCVHVFCNYNIFYTETMVKYLVTP
jgi:hypothetical protein